MLGTVLGGLLGALAGPALGGLPWLFVPAMGAMGGVAVYRALASEFSYAWVLGGATALITDAAGEHLEVPLDDALPIVERYDHYQPVPARVLALS